MKTKILSLLMAIVMLVSTVMLPAFAEPDANPEPKVNTNANINAPGAVIERGMGDTDKDKEMAAQGYVCRVGDTYYKYLTVSDDSKGAAPVAADAGISHAADGTIELIADITLVAKKALNITTDLSIDGHGYTYTTSEIADGITVNNKKLVVSNLVVVGSGVKAASVNNNYSFGFVTMKGGSASLTNCVFQTNAARSNAGGYFTSASGTNTMELIDCTIRVDNAVTDIVTHLFFAKAALNLTLQGTTADLCQTAPSVMGLRTNAKTDVVMTNTSFLFNTNAIYANAATTVTLNNTTLSSNAAGIEIEASTTGITMNGTSSVTSTNDVAIQIMDGKTANLDLEMNGASKASGKSYGFKAANCADSTVKIVMNDNAVMTSECAAASDVVVRAFGSGQKVNINMTGNSRIYTEATGNANYALNVDHGNAPTVTLNMSDNAQMSTGGTTAINLGSTPFTAYVFDKASICSAPNSTALSVPDGKTTIYKDASSTITGYEDYVAPTMIKGASVRISGDENADNGIRFTAQISENAKGATLGIILAKWTDISTNDVLNQAFTVEALPEAMKFANKSVVLSDQETDGLNKGEGNYTYNLALTNLPDYTEEFAARAYAEYKDGNQTVVVYSTFDTTVDTTLDAGRRLDNVRSIRAVAIAALADTEETANEEYRFNVGTADEPKYSPYSKDQYDRLSAYVA